MLNNDLFFASNGFIYIEDEDVYHFSLYLYGLKSNGEKYFNGEFLTKPSDEYSEFNSVSIKMDNNEYPLICSQDYCFIIDLENDNIYTEEFENFFPRESDISFKYSEFFSLINLNKENEILFSYISANSLYLSIIKFQSIDFSSYAIQNSFSSNSDTFEINKFIQNTKCFITKNKIIECLYVNMDKKFTIALFSQTLNYLNSIILDQDEVKKEYPMLPFNNPINMIHLKNEIGIFAYYIYDTFQTTFKPIRIQINELIIEDDVYKFKNIISDHKIIEIKIDDYFYLNDCIACERTNYEFLIKINEKKFFYAYDYSDYIIIIVMLDLFGNNDDEQNLLIRYYKINLNLYNLIFFIDLKLFIFNSFLGMLLITENPDDSKRYSLIIIFGDLSKTPNELSLEVYKKNQGFLLELQKFFRINNNLFGYELDIKISSFSANLNGIKFYSIKNNIEIHVNDIINEEDSILFDFSDADPQICYNNIITINCVLTTPKYENLFDYIDKQDKYGDDDFKNFYEKKIIEEKVFKLELIFSCHESSISCNYPKLSTKTIENDDNKIIYFSNFQKTDEIDNLLEAYIDINNYDNSYCESIVREINQYILNNNCVDMCPNDDYILDASNNKCIYVRNEEIETMTKEKDNKNNDCQSLYYIDEKLNIICLSSLFCDENHPILNEETNECIIYRVKYGDEYFSKCPENTCISQNSPSLDTCEDKLLDMKVFNGICFDDYSNIINNIEEISKNNNISNIYKSAIISVYSYNNYSQNFNQIIQNNINAIIIDLRECIKKIKQNFDLDENIDIYIVTIETPKIYSNESTNRFNFELYFSNKTKINNLDVCKNIKMEVYSPVKNSRLDDLIKLAKYFYVQGGYNIFNKNDKFYTDICSSAYLDGNDLTLNDRYNEIYPHDVQICPQDCECSGVNFTTNTFICDCYIKSDDYKIELTNKNEIINYFKNVYNLLEYFSDLINYKIIKCYKLLIYLKNYNKNIGFYIGLFLYILAIILLIIFHILGYREIRIILHKNYETLKNFIFTKSDGNNYTNKDLNIEDKDKKSQRKNESHSSKKKTHQIKIYPKNSKNDNKENNNIDSDTFIYSGRKMRKKNTYANFSKRNTSRSINEYKNILSPEDQKENHIEEEPKENDNENKNNNEENKNKKNEDINELPYYIAKKVDKRNFFKTFFSFFVIKVEIIQITFFPDDYSSRYILYSLYIVNEYFNLLTNCLLFNDYAVSQKYHNNGNLQFLTSFIMSILSNIFTLVISYSLQKLVNYPKIITKIIDEIKDKNHYLIIINRISSIIKFKIIFLLIVEILSGLFMIYYLFIFSVIYSKTVFSFLLNYLLSDIESLIYSSCLSFIITILRRIGISSHIKRIYIISMFFNENF